MYQRRVSSRALDVGTSEKEKKIEITKKESWKEIRTSKHQYLQPQSKFANINQVQTTMKDMPHFFPNSSISPKTTANPYILPPFQFPCHWFKVCPQTKKTPKDRMS
jgi:hypothetical protein